jgi:putative addiction module component (TIGR02574 family)
MSNLQNEIGSLSAAEKFELIDVLWESLEADAAALTDEQRTELDYRVAKYEQNPSDVISWESVPKRGNFPLTRPFLPQVVDYAILVGWIGA